MRDRRLLWLGSCLVAIGLALIVVGLAVRSIDDFDRGRMQDPGGMMAHDGFLRSATGFVPAVPDARLSRS